MRAPEDSTDAQRAFAHITGRSRQGAFASQLWNWSDERWLAALDVLRCDQQLIRWSYGTVADDPTVTGGWILAQEVSDLDDGRITPSDLLVAALRTPGGNEAVKSAVGDSQDAETVRLAGLSCPIPLSGFSHHLHRVAKPAVSREHGGGHRVDLDRSPDSDCGWGDW
jgi:hypothetical protein